jgi:uncharacterized protein with beta-barrel porin domain
MARHDPAGRIAKVYRRRGGLGLTGTVAAGVSLFLQVAALAQSVQVTTPAALGANDIIDWAQVGPPITHAATPFIVTSNGGLTASVSTTSGQVFSELQGNQWNGNYAPNAPIIGTGQFAPASPIVITFATPVQGVGAQFGFNVGGVVSSTATLDLFNTLNVLIASYSVTGTTNSAADNSAPFIGALDATADIASISIFDGPLVANPGFSIGDLSLVTTSSAQQLLNPNPFGSNLLLLLGAINNEIYNNFGNITIGNGGSLTNQLNAILNNQGTFTNLVANGLTNVGTFNDLGSLDNESGASIDNSGSFAVDEAPLLDFTNALGNASSVASDTTGVMINAGTFNNSGAGTITNNGILLDSGTINNAGTIANTATGALIIQGSLINLISGTINNIGPIDVPTSGTLTNQGTLNNNISPTQTGIIQQYQNANASENSLAQVGQATAMLRNLTNFAGSNLSQHTGDANDFFARRDTRLIFQALKGISNAANNGTLNVNGTVNNSGTINNGGTFNLHTGAVLNGSGTFNQTGGFTTVDGTATQAVFDISGGIVFGSGTLDGAVAIDAATLSPGDAPGTLTINGSLTLTDNSLYNWKVDYSTNPIASDRIVINGPATVGGIVLAAPLAAGPGAFQSQNFTILTASGGVTGTFDAAITAAVFLTPTLSYDANDVYLNLARNAISFGAAGQTNNQIAVGNGLQAAQNAFSLVANPSGNPILNNLVIQSQLQAQSIFDSLSGAGIPGAENVAFGAGSLFASTIADESMPYGSGGTSSGTRVALNEEAPAALAYAQGSTAFPNPIAFRPQGEPVQRWHGWFSGFGAGAKLAGDANVGSLSETDVLGGGAAGLDYQVLPNWIVGIAGGGSEGLFSVPSLSTSGSVVGGHGGVYTFASSGASYVQASATYSGFANTTHRQIAGFGALAGENETGRFGSEEVRGHVEVGYTFDMTSKISGAYAVTPFVGLSAARLHTGGFTEQANGSGAPGMFSLAVSDQDLWSVPFFIGTHLDQSFILDNQMVVKPSITLAYVHEFSPQRPLQASLVSLPAASFVVDGAGAAPDAAQVKLGAELAVSHSMSLFARFQGEFAQIASTYAGTVGMTAHW